MDLRADLVWGFARRPWACRFGRHQPVVGVDFGRNLVKVVVLCERCGDVLASVERVVPPS